MSQIAIDGPAGVGKSTAAKNISKLMDFMYVDTGAMYRTIGLACLEKETDLEDETAVSSVCAAADIDVVYKDGIQYMFLEGKDVSSAIRKEEVGKAASAVSKYAAVRSRLVNMQQQLALKYDVVMDGRDIGTKVLPNADLKIYLTASSSCRAQRRYDELREKGEECDFDAIKKDIEERDHNDMTRAISPLKKADDAVEVDTSDMSIEEVTSEIIRLFKEKNGSKGC